MSGELVRYDAMCRAIDAAYEVDEVKDIRDKARAMELYLRQQRNPEPERRACEIRLRAERKVGQLLRDMEKAKGGGNGSNQHAKSNWSGGSTGSFRQSRDTTTETKTLKSLGISKDESSQWQKLAAIPEEDFEAALAAPGRPTTTGIIEAAKASPAVKPMDDRALWLWGRLRDFERDASPVLDDDPIRLINEMTDQMRADVVRLIPRVCAWLERIISA